MGGLTKLPVVSRQLPVFDSLGMTMDLHDRREERNCVRAAVPVEIPDDRSRLNRFGERLYDSYQGIASAMPLKASKIHPGF